MSDFSRAAALRRVFLLALFGGGLTISGCSSVLTEGAAAGAGIAGTAVAGAVTKDAATTAAIGLGVDAVALSGVKALEKRVHGEEQAAIAAAAGSLGAGESGPWSVSHRIPIEAAEHGQVSVSRQFGAAAVSCKEVVFSVEKSRGKPARRVYVTTICQDAGVWRWAAAEPATPRWGSLQ